jgi:hypothetical protein
MKERLRSTRPYLPQDIIDALHLAAGTMACIDTGIHEQQIDRVLGIECIDEAAERHFVGDVDRAGYAPRSRASAERCNIIEPTLVAGNEAQCAPCLGIFHCQRRART